jgi:eukaryotic-like serine/threonine-protein kinase
VVHERISHYRILKKLGSGGMGEVYLSEDTNLGRTVALKILPLELATNPDRLRRFIHEARAASAIKHPNVASIYELGESDGLHYIAMEHVEGETLNQRIVHPLAVSEILDIAIQTADALDEAHAKGIIHRDLKPANIMITTRGQVKVLDFGLAKMQEGLQQQLEASELETRTKTEPGIVMGTVQYMSPEQALGKTVDQRSDIFSLGVVLYQMATGRLPFLGASVTETVNRIVNSNPEAIARLNYDIPADLEHVVRRCMEKDPDRRYQTARDLLIDLKNLKRDTESGVGVPPTIYAGQTAVKSRWPIILIVVASIMVVGLTGFLLLREKARPGQQPSPITETSSRRKMIAVLPFENLGSAEDQYFAAGITEEITSRLAGVQDLGVISRTSANQYEKSGKRSIKQIGQELGVDYVLEGSVRWDRANKETSRVRITPQLIRVSDDTHLWSEIYDRVINDVFQVQSEIASSVIQQLNVHLNPPEKKAFAGSTPTSNIEAYEEYLRGVEYAHAPGNQRENFEAQITHFENAIQLDPNFARAYAFMARAHLRMYHEGFDPTPERIALAKQSIDKALALQPDLPAAYVALGFYHYHGHNDYNSALQAFNRAAKAVPNDPEVLSAMAYVERRQGKFEESIRHMEKAFELDPRSSDHPLEIATILMRLRRYSEAEQFIDRSLALAPQYPYGYGAKWMNIILWKGSLADARTVLEKMPAVNPLWMRQELYIRQEIFERNYANALKRLGAHPVEVIQEEGLFLPKDLIIGRLYSLSNQPKLAKKHFELARVLLENEAQKRPQDLAVRLSLGRVYAGLGMRDKAREAASLDAVKNDLSKDHFMGPIYYTDSADIYAQIGEAEKSIQLLDHLLSIPSGVSVPLLRIDLQWEPLRKNRDFQRMLQRHQKEAY